MAGIKGGAAIITFSKPEYIDDLKKLWQETFGDSERFLNSFFERIYKDENTLVEITGGRVSAALYMVIYHIPQGGIKLPVSYLYALATKKEYQGRGIMSGLVEKALELSRERGYALSVLVPAEPSLAGYYRRFGYEYLFDRCEASLSRAQLEKATAGFPPADFRPADSGEIWRLYSRSAFCADSWVCLSKPQSSFYLDELLAGGGKALAFSVNGKEHYALITCSEDTLSVLESTADKEAFGPFCSGLLQSFSFKTASFFQPLFIPGTDAPISKTPYAMAKSLNDTVIEKPFLNRVFT